MQSVVTVFIPLFPSQTCVYSIGHLYTLQITAKAARLQHAQPGGAAAGKELLVAAASPKPCPPCPCPCPTVTHATGALHLSLAHLLSVRARGSSTMAGEAAGDGCGPSFFRVA